MSSRRNTFRSRGLTWSASILLSFCIPVTSVARELTTTDETFGEQRFFAQCPHRRLIRLHRETNPWDVHALVYTTTGLAEVEVLRVADWLIDLPCGGAPLKPFRRTIRAIRSGYNRLPPWDLTQRVGEFVNALQLPELSFGDATATYSVATGGVTGPGSGMIVRINKLIDWGQHVIGDLNRLSGRCLGRRQGLMTWYGPGHAIDGMQWLLIKTFTHANVFIARGVDAMLDGIEISAEQVLNVGRQSPHETNTVFLRVPIEVYRAHELWILEHRAHVVLGTLEAFRHSTHAAMAHQHDHSALQDWALGDQSSDQTSVVIMMTTVRIMARAPDSLKPYVVPASWVLNQE